eukprot:CAMPEP_0170602450 /NCGR_PEP_ID=MMETSP0224-20130122/18395_1 /TAXON_ID=285029 /ORGANISM="Togula jolla, Strain CCCM 725" /LENGTH=43 /DNA_ID= /DNA_START= /DNA_END= /DNA_ORIENTATION=
MAVVGNCVRATKSGDAPISGQSLPWGSATVAGNEMPSKVSAMS